MLRKSITFPDSTAEKRQCWDSESGHLPLNHPASHIPDPRTSFLFPSTSHIPHQVSSPVYNVPFTLSSAWAIILMSTHAGHFSKHGHAHHLIRLSEVPRCVPVRPSKMNWTADSHSRKKAEFLQLSSKWPVATLNQVFFFSLCVWTIMIILKKSTSLIQFFFTLGHVICQLIWKSPFTGSFPCLLWFLSVYCIKAKVLRLNFETLHHQIHSTLSRSSPTDGLFSLPQKEAACSAMTLWAWVTRIPWNFITPYINMIS